MNLVVETSEKMGTWSSFNSFRLMKAGRGFQACKKKKGGEFIGTLA